MPRIKLKQPAAANADDDDIIELSPELKTQTTTAPTTTAASVAQVNIVVDVVVAASRPLCFLSDSEGFVAQLLQYSN